MATLRFRYSPMNAGKSSNLLQVAHNYNERGMNVLLMKPSLDTKGDDRVVARGMKDSRKVDYLVTPNMNIYDLVVEYLKKNNKEYTDNSFLIERIKKIESDPKKIDAMYNVINDYLVNQGYDNRFDKILSAILIDEAQFLTEKQVKELSDITVILDIPVICFGLRTDFKGNLFPGSEALFRYANSLEELTTERKITNCKYINMKVYQSFFWGVNIIMCEFNK